MAFVNSYPALPSTRSFNARKCISRSSTPRVAPRMVTSYTKSDPPPPLTLKDTASIWISNILILLNLQSPRDNIPIAEGDMSAALGESPFFLSLHEQFLLSGAIYKLAFGPKVFIVIQDPAMVRDILKENSILYSKGILREVLDEIMGDGLIPADYETWLIRRRAIVPGFHRKWLEFQTGMFVECAEKMCEKMEQISGQVVDMETEYSSLALDIVGRAVFNYDFDSICSESPVIKAVYRALKETEHRSTSPFPYWKLPGAPSLVPRLRAFYADMRLINDTLTRLIRTAKESATSADLSELEARDYENVEDPSLLRFLVELRGEETTNQQLRDDLMTILIAGHETTAAVLTWATVELEKNPQILQKAREEIDSVLGDRNPSFKDVAKLPYLRRIIAETLRLYPAPPVLIRRLLADTTLPSGSSSLDCTLARGTDIFINVYSLHRSAELWDQPETFDPDRWLRPKHNPGVEGWSGYQPAAGLEEGKPLYPTELNADFAFLPFGGGSRKCVGDSFAMLETVVTLAMVIQRFEFVLSEPDKPVEMTTGATIHTARGLNMKLRKRGQDSADPTNEEKKAKLVTPVQL